MMAGFSVDPWERLLGMGINTFTFQRERSHNWVCFEHTELFALPLKPDSSTPSPSKLADFSSSFSLCLFSMLFSLSLSFFYLLSTFILLYYIAFLSCSCFHMPPHWICRTGCREHSGCIRLLPAIATWIRVTGSLELLSWIFSPLIFSATPLLNTRGTICYSLALYKRVISLLFSLFLCLSSLLSLHSFSPSAPLGLAGWPALQIWKGSTLQASQQMAVRTYVRWCPLQHESCSAKRAKVTVQQIQVVTTVVGSRSKQLFREILHVCLW